MNRTSFVSIAPGIAVRADYRIRAMEDRIGKYDIRISAYTGIFIRPRRAGSLRIPFSADGRAVGA